MKAYEKHASITLPISNNRFSLKKKISKNSYSTNYRRKYLENSCAKKNLLIEIDEMNL